MKKLTSIIAAVLMLTSSLAAPILVHAEATADNTVTTTSAEDKTTITAKAEAETETEAEKSARSARLETIKKAFKEKLSETVKTRIASRCVAAQALVNAHTTRSDGYIKSRTKVYDNLVSRLEKTLTNVGADGINNLALETNIVELKTMIAEFKTTAATYQQLLADVAAMDCKADPTAFKAALETARANQQITLKAAAAVKTYLTDTIKLTLKALKEASDAANNSTE